MDERIWPEGEPTSKTLWKCSNAGTQFATIIGGRWDGLEVEYMGPRVVYAGVVYAALRTEYDVLFYMPESLRDQWFVFHDDPQDQA